MSGSGRGRVALYKVAFTSGQEAWSAWFPQKSGPWTRGWWTNFLDEHNRSKTKADLEESDNFGDGSGVADEASDLSETTDALLAGPLADGAEAEGAADAVALHEDGVHGVSDLRPGHGDAGLAARWVLHLASRTELRVSRFKKTEAPDFFFLFFFFIPLPKNSKV